MRRIQVQIGSVKVRAQLLEREAPQFCGALLKVLPVRSKAVHAMYSGTACIVPQQVDYQVQMIENRKAFMVPGFIYYFRPDAEIVVPYEATQFRTPLGSEYVTQFARFEGDVSALSRVGSRLQMTGAKDFVMKLLG